MKFENQTSLAENRINTHIRSEVVTHSALAPDMRPGLRCSALFPEQVIRSSLLQTPHCLSFGKKLFRQICRMGENCRCNFLPFGIIPQKKGAYAKPLLKVVPIFTESSSDECKYGILNVFFENSEEFVCSDIFAVVNKCYGSNQILICRADRN